MLARPSSPIVSRRLERAGWLRAGLAWLVALVVSFPFLYVVLTGLKPSPRRCRRRSYLCQPR